MRLTDRVCLFALCAVLSLVQGCATAPRQSPAPAAPSQAAHPSADKDSDATPAAARRRFRAAIGAMEARQWDQARQRLLALVRDYPALAGVYANLGVVYARQDKLQEAVQVLRRAIELDPRSAPVFNQLGIVYRRMGKLDQARLAYQRALQVNPGCANAQLNLGILYDIYFQDYAKALTYYRRYQALTDKRDKQVAVWIVELQRRTED